MGEVSLELFRMHVRIDDYTGQDALLQHCLEAAEERVTASTNRTADELREMGSGTYPAPLRQAIMMLAGHLFDHPEGVSQGQMHEIPWGISSLIMPYRRIEV